MAVIIGSARHDEHGNITGGQAGDQTGSEVATQNFYVHSKGWYVLRPKSADIANKMAKAMRTACDNNNIGYGQNNRLDVLKYGTSSKVKTECDCSSLVRLCVKEASGKDPGNFNTANEVAVLEASGLFEAKKSYTSGMTLYTGDVLVTKTKGHTVIVVSGTARQTASITSGTISASATTVKPSSSTSTTPTSNKITVDGEWGQATTKAAQKVFKTTVDGIVSRQVWKYKKYLTGCLTSSWQFFETASKYKGGSELIKAIQKWVGVSQDGLCGPATIKALQKKLGVSADGYFGSKSVKAFQTYLNKYL